MVVANFLQLTSNLGAKVKRVSHGGRSYLVAPASLIVPGVLNGSDGPGYYPPEENTRNVSAWDGMPIVAYHPVTENGEPTSALDDEGKVDRKVYLRVGLGALRNSRGHDGRLLSEAWFDEEHVRNYDAKLFGDAKILPRLNAEQPIELSTGLHVDKDVQNGTCPKTNRPYTWVARNHRPDHLAVLPDQRGACSVEDGCGVVVNADKGESEGQWVTISGTHVLVKEGEIVGGPPALVGKSKAEATSGDKMSGVSKKVDALVKRIKESGGGKHDLAGKPLPRGGKTETSPLRGEADKINAEVKSLTEKMSTFELVKALGLSKTPGWPKEKLQAAVQKSLGDRMGSAFRVNNEDATENTGRYGNPQCGDSGKFMKHGSGTGKGETHAAAREGRHGPKTVKEPVENDCAGGLADNCSQTSKVTNQGDTTMALPANERVTILNRIVANCGCSDEDRGVLNTLSDSALLKLNAMETDDGSPVESETEGAAKEGEGKKVPPQFAKNQRKEPTVNVEIKTPTFEDLLNAAPPAYRAVWNTAVKVEHRERKALLDRIVANLAADKREATWNAFKDKPIGELEAIADLVPAPATRNVQQHSSPFPVFPNYAGAGAGNPEGVTNQSAEEEDLLDIPVMNWTEKVGA